MIIAEQRAHFLKDIKNLNSSARLMAVSKRQPDAKVEAALSCGQRLFGENRIQEAGERWGAKRAQYPDLELHLIGSLQTNKVKEAVTLFDVIQTLDREKLARALSKEMQAQARNLPCFIQVNTGEEEHKGGILPYECADFLAFCQQECELNIMGLMCLPPADEPAALHFALLKKLAQKYEIDELSMGMSGDYHKALALGATLIRVGSAFFGAREAIIESP